MEGTAELRLIQGKAMSLFEDVTAKAEEEYANETFTASQGWCYRFKNCVNIHQVPISDEAVNTGKLTAGKYVVTLKELIVKEGYLPEQIFNVDEAGLFWRKMTDHKLKLLLVYRTENPRALRISPKAHYLSYECLILRPGYQW